VITSATIGEAVTEITAEAKRLVDVNNRPVVVALDGPSGSGKSTLAAALVKVCDAVVIPCDDFYASDIPDGDWDRLTAEERLRNAIHWRRLRDEGILALLNDSDGDRRRKDSI
jgi:uridine kinase